MPTTRREFLKSSVGMVTISVVLPKLWPKEARAQEAAANPARRIFVVIQLAGGNDGLNTVIPYTDSNYYAKRPTLSFKDTELKDAQGRSMIISNEFGLHPAMSKLKELYDAGKVAIVLGVGYPNPNLSHFTSMDIWQTANPVTPQGEGWLGKYADYALVGQSGLSAVSIGSALPKALFSNKVVIPSISSFNSYDFLTDPKYTADRSNQMNLFNQTYGRSFPSGSYIASITETGLDAVKGAAKLRASVGTYSSPIVYPNTGLAQGMKMLAQIITTIPEANLLYVSMGGFDNHSAQIGAQGQPTNKLVGTHASLLAQFSDAVKAFYDDMQQHGLADNVVMMTWSEFGRRVNENASNGTDHGTASPQFVIGNPVRGGIYGIQPSLAATELDSAGNMKFKVDFREIYATILRKWLNTDPALVLGSQFKDSDVGFL
jgi:uncharacterized protein (DUF1501 family)